MRGNYYLNFNDLSEEAQQELIQEAKDDLEETQKSELEALARGLGIPYEQLLHEQAERHIYSFNYVFNV